MSGTTFNAVKRLPGCKCGRKVMLGKQLDGRIQNYVKALRNAGTPIASSVIMAAATGFVNSCDMNPCSGACFAPSTVILASLLVYQVQKNCKHKALPILFLFFLLPIISHLPVPPRFRKKHIVLAVSRGMWPTTTSFFRTDTALESFSLSSSYLRTSCSPTTGLYMRLYTWWPRTTLSWLYTPSSTWLAILKPPWLSLSVFWHVFSCSLVLSLVSLGTKPRPQAS